MINDILFANRSHSSILLSLLPCFDCIIIQVMRFKSFTFDYIIQWFLVLLCRRALRWNLLFMLLFLATVCLAGLVMYAVYGRCDPRTAGLVKSNDQVQHPQFQSNFDFPCQLSSFGISTTVSTMVFQYCMEDRAMMHHPC